MNGALRKGWNMRWFALCAGVILAAARAALGEPLAGSSLPADTRWVIHVDVDGARQAKPLWEAARGRLGDLPRAALRSRAAVLERITGMKIPEELLDVTLHSATYDEGGVCLRIHGKMDAGQVAAFLKTSKDFKQVSYGSHTIMQWREKERDRLMSLAFARPDLAVQSASLDAIEKTLDTLDGKAPGLPANSPLAPAGTDNGGKTLVWLAAQGLHELPAGQVESPVLTQMEAASLGVRWANDQVVSDLRVTARSEPAAQQLKALAEGIKAFVELSGAGDHAPPGLRVLAGTMDQMTVQTDGKTVKGSWPVSMDKIDMLLNVAVVGQGAGATKPATSAGTLP
jgi:hypothetical protein